MAGLSIFRGGGGFLGSIGLTEVSLEVSVDGWVAVKTPAMFSFGSLANFRETRNRTLPF